MPGPIMASVNPDIYKLERHVAYHTQNTVMEEGQNYCNEDRAASSAGQIWVLLAVVKGAPALGVGAIP